MAVGDIINACFGSAAVDFQPSSGTEIIITYCGGAFNTSQVPAGSHVGLTDGTNVSRLTHNSAAFKTRYDGFAAIHVAGGNLKIGITNAFYLSMSCMGNASYSGIQVK